ncbi:hypothetical protein [Streptomyces sp. NPDC001536]|uniref:hypothetical protein n=1 Tax=Streptomyces sp. NPDC001536 TaxID=3364583 RepID=UPI00368236DB
MTSRTSTPSEGALLVISAHAGDFAWRDGLALGAEIEFLDAGDSAQAVGYDANITPAFDKKHKAKRNAGPNLGLSHGTTGEAYVRLYPQTTGVLA